MTNPIFSGIFFSQVGRREIYIHIKKWVYIPLHPSPNDLPALGARQKRIIMFPRFVQAGSAWQLQIDQENGIGQRILGKSAARELVRLCLVDEAITKTDFDTAINEIDESDMQETQLVRSCHVCRQDHQFPLGNGRWSEKFLDIKTGMQLAGKAMRDGELLPSEVGQIREELERLGVPIERVLLKTWVMVII